MTDRSVQIGAVLSAQTSRFEAGMRKAGGAVKGFAARVEGMGRRMRAALRNTGIGNVTARLRGLGTSIAGFAGIYGVGQAIKQVRDFEDSLADLAIFSRKMETAGPGWIDKTRKEIYRLSGDTGIAKEQLAAFANTFVTLTGDADAAMSSMGEMAKVSVATGADMRDLAEVMSRLSGSLGIKNAKELTKSFAIMAYQANKGAMSFKDIAAAMPQIAGIAAGAFGATGIEGVKGIGGLLQMAARVKGKAGAETSVAAFLNQLVLKRKEAQELLGPGAQLGTETAGGKFKWKNLADISKMIGEAYAKGTAEQKEKWMRVFRMRGAGTLLALGGAAKGGWGQQVGTYESAQKIFGAGEAGGLVQRMYGERQRTAGFRIRKTMNELTNQIHQKLLPVFQKLAKHMPTIAKGLGWVIENIESLLKVWAAWKASRFFAALMAAPQQMAAMGGGRYGPGGQVAAMYGMGRAGPGAAAAKGVRPGGPSLAAVGMAGLNLWMGTELLQLATGMKARQREPGAFGMMGGIFRGGMPMEDMMKGRVAEAGGREMGAAAYAQQIATKGIGRVGMGGGGMDIIGGLTGRAGAVREAYAVAQQQAEQMRVEGRSAQEIAKALPELARLQQAMRMLDETMKRLKEGIPLEGGNTPDGRAKQRQNAQAKR